MCTCTRQYSSDDTAMWSMMLLILGLSDRADLIDERSGALVYDAWRTRAESAITHAATDAQHHRAVLIVDLDQFKGINDRFGHLAGDFVIRAAADVIRSQVRETDLVGRFGGDEFVILLDRTDNSSVHAVAERIRRGIEELAVTVEAPSGTQSVNSLTVSIGAALSEQPVSDGGRADLTAMLWAADAALYRAKRAGRNTVRVDQLLPNDGAR